MKKSQKTMLTSAILSMAAATVGMMPDAVSSVDAVSPAMAPVYGPPPSVTSVTSASSVHGIDGDANDDGTVNIADVCIMKAYGDKEPVHLSNYNGCDLNGDGLVNFNDYYSIRDYFLGKTPDIHSTAPDITTPPGIITPKTTTIETVYGPPPVTPPYEFTQPVYGTFEAVTTPPSETTEPEEDPDQTITAPPYEFTQPVYGPFEAVTTPPPAMQTKYGCYVTNEDD